MTRWYGNFFGFLADWVRFANRSDAAYRTLGVSEHASDAEIEQAYLRLMARYEPGRLVGLAKPLRRRAEKRASKIDTAYVRIRTLRKREASLEAPPAAAARSDDRGAGSLVWVALALIALVTLAWLAPLRELWAPAQAPLPAPQASVQTLPAPGLPAPGAPAPSMPAPSSPPAPVVAAPPAQNPPPVQRMVTLMPRDPPPARPAPAAPSGEAGLIEALRAGQLRPATGGDLSRWAARWSQASRRSVPAVFQERSVQMTAYVIQKDFTIPDGLYGAHSVIFLLETRVPYPRGNPGHSAILDQSTGACRGALCGILLD